MHIQFLGTGAADWFMPLPSDEPRRMTSTLFDGVLLVDMMKHALERITDGDAITDILVTHSHRDHFDPEAIEGDGLTVIPLRVGQPVEAAGFTVTPMPSNHSTQRANETTLHYLLEKDGKRLLYATDGAWLLNAEHHIIGDRTLDAVVFDATIGDGHEGDFRVFEHNSLDMIRIMLMTMLKTGRLKGGAPVFLTHLARTLNAPQDELERHIKRPFVVCRDGLTAEI